MTPAETPKVGDWCWHIHHEVLIEKLTEPFETRKAYIKAGKPKHEVEKRLRLMKPASKKASGVMAVYAKASSEAWAKVEALHQKECPSCPWNGRTIFP